MASIRVTLELDDKGYITRIKAADAATSQLGKTAATAGATGAAGVGMMTTAMVGLRAAATAAMTAMAPLLAVATALAAVKGAITLANDIDDLAATTGIAGAKIIALRDALRQAGGDSDSAGQLITKLTNYLDDAASGSEKAINRFADLGISMQDIAKMSPEQALDATIQALAKMDDPVKRNAIAFELLGKQAARIEWDKVAKGTATTTEAQRRQAETAKKVADATERFENMMANLQLKLLELLEPFADLSDRMGRLTNLTSVGTVIFKALQGVFAATAVTAYGLYTSIDALIGGLIALYQSGVQAIQGNFSGAGDILSAYATKTKENFADVVDFAKEQFNKLVGVAPPAEQVTGGGGGGGGGDNRPTVDPTAKERAKIDDVSEAYKEANKQIREKLQLEYDNLRVVEEEQKVAAARLEVQQKATAEIDKLNTQLEGLDLTKATDRSIAAAIRKEVAEIQNLVAAEQAAVETTIRSGEARKRSYADSAAEFQKIYDIESFRRNIEMMRELETATTEAQKEEIKLRYAAEEQYQKDLLELRKKYGAEIPKIEMDIAQEANRRRREVLAAQTGEIAAEGARKQTPEYVIEQFARGLDQLTDPLKVLESSVSSVFGNMTSAIDNFVETGKFKFGDFARSVIADLIKIQMKAVATSIFKSVLGAVFPGANIPGKALGGPVGANMPYLVGERGPELFVPNTSGKIIPNNQITGDAMNRAAKPTQVTYNINAVDALSFKQLVASDPQFIYSVTQVGSRSIPR